MSKTVDERVVEMRFNNSQFEKNAAESMTTVEKLKKSLDMKQAAQNFNSINDSAKKVNLSGLGSAIDTVKLKFSALQVFAVTALQNITNQAVNAGKRIISALTIDPVRTGFQEYETQINATQTILANTQHEGTTLQQVNRALDELNLYADKTIYNFTQMTKNIGTFTAAGVDLETATQSIKGIANLAALSGSGADKAAMAMYQLSQAIASGRVNLQDWNSVVTSGMGGKVFQDALIRTSTLLKTGAKKAIKEYGLFRESLSKGKWLTTKVLTETLRQFAGAYTEADLLAQGYSKDQAASIVKMAETAEEAATKVKTFTQLWETLKESAQSGWTQSWEIIIGDFEEAKATLTEVSDVVGSMILQTANARNELYSKGLSSGWKQLLNMGIEDEAGYIEEIEIAARSNNKAFQEMISKTKDFGTIVNNSMKEGILSTEMLNAAFFNLQSNLSKMSDKQRKKVGYTKSEYKEITALASGLMDGTIAMESSIEQIIDLVDRKVIRQKDYIKETQKVVQSNSEAFDRIVAQSETFSEALKEGLKQGVVSSETLTNAVFNLSDKMTNMTEKERKAAGYTDEMVKSIQNLSTGLRNGSVSMDEFISKIQKSSGRENVIQGLWNIFNNLLSVVRKVKEAFLEVFPAMTGDQLYSLTEKFKNFTEKIKLSEESLEQLKITFKGIFSVFGLLKDAIVAVWNAIKPIFGGLPSLGDGFLGITAHIGESITAFREWVSNNQLFPQIVKSISKSISSFVQKIKEWVSSIKLMPQVQIALDKVKEFFIYVGSVIRNFISSLNEGKITLSDIGKFFSNAFLKISTKIKETTSGVMSVKDAFGTLSSAVKTKANEIGNTLSALWKNISGFWYNIKNKLVLKVDWGKVAGITVLVGFAASLYKTYKLIQKISGIADKFGNLASGLGSIFSGVGKILSAKAAVIKSERWKNYAIAIAAVAGSIMIVVAAVKMLSGINPGDLNRSGQALSQIIFAMIALIAAVGAVNKLGGFGEGNSSALTILALVASIMLMVYALKTIAAMNPDTVVLAAGILVSIIAGLVAGMAILSKFAPKLSENAQGLIAMAASIWIMAKAIDSISKIEITDPIKTISVAVSAILGLVALAAATKKMGNWKSGLGLLAMAVAMKLFISVIADIANMDFGVYILGLIRMATVVGMFLALMAITKLAGENAAKGGVAILAMSAAMILLTIAIKLIASISQEDLTKAGIVIGVMLVLFGGLAFMSAFSGRNADKAGTMILKMSAAILVLVAAIAILTLLDPDRLFGATAIIAVLTIIMGGLIAVTKLAQDCKTTLTLITVIVVLLAAAVAILATLDPANVVGAAAALSMVIGMVAILVAVSSIAGTAWLGMLLVAAIIAVLAGAIYILTTLPVKKVLAVAISLSTLLLVLTASMVAMTLMGVLAVAAVAGVIAMIGVIVAVGGLMLAIAGLNKLFPGLNEFLQTAIPTLTTIGEAIGNFFGSIASSLMNTVGSALPSFGENLEKFATHVEPFVTIMDGMKDKDILTGIKQIVAAMSLLAGAEITNAIANWIGGENSMETMGSALESFGESLAAFDSATKDINGEHMQGVVDAAKALSEMMSALSLAETAGGLLDLLPFGGKKETTIDFEAFKTSCTDLGGAIMAFQKAVEKVDYSIVSDGVKAATDLMGMASELPTTGGLWDILEKGTTVSMQDFAAGLRQIGWAMRSFSSSSAELKYFQIEKGCECATLLFKTMGDLPTTGGILNQCFGTGSKMSMTDVATAIKELGDAMVTFSDKVANVNGTQVKHVAEAGDDLANMLATVYGIKIVQQQLTLSDFQTACANLGSAISDFGTNVKDIIYADIENGCKAGERIIQMIAEIPTEGGLKNWFTSSDKMDLKVFADGVWQIGLAISLFESAAGDVNTDNIENACVAGERIITMCSSIPTQGGFWNWLSSGDIMPIDTFATGVIRFGQGIKSFESNVQSIKYYSVEKGCLAGEKIADMCSKIPTTGGLWDLMFGETLDMGQFANIVGQFAEIITNFAAEMAENNVDPGQLDTAITAANSMVDFLTRINSAQEVMSMFTSVGSMTNFSTNLASFAGAISTFSSTVETIDTTKTDEIIAQLKELATITFTEVATAAENISDQFKTTGTTIIDCFNSGVEGCANAVYDTVYSLLSNAESKVKSKMSSEFTALGVSLVTSMNSGLRMKSYLATQSCTAMVVACRTALRNKYSEFYSAGQYLAQGFAKGISGSAKEASSASSAMAAAAAKAATTTLQIKSPSKVGYQIGSYFGQGFTNSINDAADASYDAGANVATSATMGLREAIAHIGQIVDESIESNPVIRPILDLTQVQSGSNRLSALLSRSQAMQINSDITSAQVSKIQNGENGSTASNSFTFTQNNYSPKALSRIEIYRQTKNQFSALEGLVTP